MVSDSELVDRLREILQSSDLETTTPGTVRRQLEKDLGVDLSERKRFISHQIDEILATHAKNEAGDEETLDEAATNGTASAKDESEEEGTGEVEEDTIQEEEEEDDDVEEEEEEDDADDRLVNNKRRSKKPSSDEVSPKKKRGGGFTKVCSLSPRLEEFFGTSELARTEVVKRLWAYIRENDLQDPSNRRIIRCDEKLRAIFNVDRIDMFQMNKALSKHIWPLEADESSVSSSAKEKKNKQVKEDEDEPKIKAKKQKGGNSDVDELKIKLKKQKAGNSGLNAPIPLSEALINFLGTGETQLSRSEVVKRMWEYFKKNDLQDPSNKRIILCDDKLKELFEVDNFLGFSIAKLLSSHFIKPER